MHRRMTPFLLKKVCPYDGGPIDVVELKIFYHLMSLKLLCRSATHVHVSVVMLV